jgi:hypothetical protein
MATRFIELVFKDDSWRSKDYLEGNTNTSLLTNGDELIMSAINTSLTTPSAFRNNFLLTASSTSNFLIKAKSTYINDTLIVSFTNTVGSTISDNVAGLDVSYGVFELPMPASSFGTISEYSFIGTMSSSTYSLDFIAFEENPQNEQDLSGNINYQMSMQKKVVSQAVPNAIDVIQQLGMPNPQYVYSIIDFNYSTVAWFMNSVANNYPMAVLTPSLSFTGFLIEAQATRQAAWPVYQGQMTFIKGDNF